jgi:hypothetical protein
MKDTTGTDGEYSFVRTFAVQLPALVTQAENMALINCKLERTLSNPSPVKVEMSDVKGSLVHKEAITNAAGGKLK